MFHEIDPKELTENVFSLLDDRWTLITAGTPNHCNTMTASWGGLGVLWAQNVATIYVRPQRYTFEFLEKYPEFTLSFFTEEYRPQLTLCGTESGRETDKVKECGFTLCSAGETAPYFEEASLVLVCRKLYWHDIDPEHFLDPALPKFYSQKDYHRLYIGAITKTLIK